MEHAAVALINEEVTAKLLAIEDRPAAAGDPIAFVGSLEGEFDRQQAELSVTFSLQRQVGRIHHIEIVDVPQIRLDDAPRTKERVLRRSTGHHKFTHDLRFDHAPGTNGIRPSSYACSWSSRGIIRMSTITPLTRIIQTNGLSASRL